MKKRPQWDSTLTDLSRYKLPTADLLKRKVALVSKNRDEAGEEWKRRQEKLTKGDEEETWALVEKVKPRQAAKRPINKSIEYFAAAKENGDPNAGAEPTLDLNSVDEEVTETLTERLEIPLTRQEITPILKQRSVSRHAAADSGRKAKVATKKDDIIAKVERNLTETRDFIKVVSRANRRRDVNPATVLQSLEGIQKVHGKTEAEKVVGVTRGSDVITTIRSPDFAAGLFGSDSGTKRTTEREASGEEERDVVNGCFGSLNQIEDTIKFLEENVFEPTKVEPVSPLRACFHEAPKEDERQELLRTAERSATLDWDSLSMKLSEGHDSEEKPRPLGLNPSQLDVRSEPFILVQSEEPKAAAKPLRDDFDSDIERVRKMLLSTREDLERMRVASREKEDLIIPSRDSFAPRQSDTFVSRPTAPSNVIYMRVNESLYPSGCPNILDLEKKYASKSSSLNLRHFLK